ncbi:MAG TPA: cupin domain-containing protein [Thermoanaerobaculia bacterium]|nr:cupin domain-containing protein [Thermoanaerobaculia bacterium]
MVEVHLERWDPSDGTLTERRMMSLMEREGYEVAVYAYREGTEFSPHEHSQDKCDAVLQGVLRVTVGAENYDLGPGDRLYLPAGTRHSARVLGVQTVLSLDGTRW